MNRLAGLTTVVGVQIIFLTIGVLGFADGVAEKQRATTRTGEELTSVHISVGFGMLLYAAAVIAIVAGPRADLDPVVTDQESGVIARRPKRALTAPRREGVLKPVCFGTPSPVQEVTPMNDHLFPTDPPGADPTSAPAGAGRLSRYSSRIAASTASMGMRRSFRPCRARG